ncbi:LysR family substrate-binding domain-containing protein [Cellulomonas palmilytica]|uniref:LysR family substrate-binding domain-containing protein n=1 Tax=Cellulomonas palmilytica TaxID=2608402 RepID=UPI001F1DFAF4|nr:LysR family substrate-binding domain-containing protein [Cellulomonas palmilytica]UJP40828.1 LysR family substrate-binding domain-containing protein [Cellulomonas palmilytica]
MTDLPDESTPHEGSTTGSGFRLGMVPGVNPGRWVRVWEERIRDVPLELVPVPAADAERALRAGEVAASLLRLPVDRDGVDVITMYTEATVVVVPKDHLFTAAEEITAADLADETVVVPGDDVLGWSDAPGERFAGEVATTDEALDLVAAGHAVLLAPHSVARLHLRRGLTTRPVTDAPGSAVGLAWLVDAYDDLTEELIGIVRGRTAASSRGRAGAETPAAPGTGKSAGKAGAGKAGAGKAGGRKPTGNASAKGSTKSGSAKSARRGSSGGRSSGRPGRKGRR